jgi:hypothetical protein
MLYSMDQLLNRFEIQPGMAQGKREKKQVRINRGLVYLK